MASRNRTQHSPDTLKQHYEVGLGIDYDQYFWVTPVEARRHQELLRTYPYDYIKGLAMLITQHSDQPSATEERYIISLPSGEELPAMPEDVRVINPH